MHRIFYSILILIASTVPALTQQVDWKTQVKNRPITTGTTAPSSSSCDASGELDTYYLQTGDPASVVTQMWSCVQTGSSSYSWQPISHKYGTTVPATCVTGQVFFDTDATAGQNWYGCTSTDTWTLLGGTGGASSVADLSDFAVTYVNAANLSVTGGSIVVGTKLFTIATDATCILTATATDTAWFYLLNGTFIIGMNDAGSSVACGTWSTATGITAFPAGSTPVYKWTAVSSAGSWDAAGGTDYRALFHRQEPEAGNGITITESGTTGRQAVAIDATSISQFTTSTSDASGSCTTGQVWVNTSSDSVWDCTHTDTWTLRGTVTASSATTLTNKTLDVEGTGNQVTTIDMRSWPAAKCQNGAAGASANLPATYSPTPVCITGTNVLAAGLTWPDADGDYSIQDSFRLPFDWSGYVNFYLKWRTSATSGDIVWQLSTACVADGETVDPSFNTAQTVTDTAKGTTLQENDATISSVTMTGCSAGETLYWKLLRNRTHASDTLAAAADLLSYAFRIRRMQ